VSLRSSMIFTSLVCGRVTNIVVWSAFRIRPEVVAAQFPEDRVIQVADEKELRAAGDAEVAFSGNNPRRVRQLLDATPNLRWYHTVSAGVENMPLSELADRGIVLTNNSGSYDIQIAEHVMAFVFAASRQLHRYRDNQRAHEWKDADHHEVRDATMVVYGMGSIGGEVARLASAVGMRVIGVRRRPVPEAGVSRVVATDQLVDVVGEADYLAITAPLTSATRGAISKEVIARMKPTAWVVNIARGAIIDEAALIEALREGRIGGAALDVFVTEPLPRESPLWDLPNVILTPHSSGDSPRAYERTLALFGENLRRYKAGEPLLNRVDFAAGY
jgi:phosphoglycerate dehydrogenase-like enzyme